jgi:hypothetical protein
MKSLILALSGMLLLVSCTTPNYSPATTRTVEGPFLEDLLPPMVSSKKSLRLKAIPIPPDTNYYSALLAWNPSASGTVVDYKNYWGPTPSHYTNSVSAGTNGAWTIYYGTNGFWITNWVTVPKVGTNFFSSTAVGSAGVESDFSNEAWGWINPNPAQVLVLKLNIQSSTNANGPYFPYTNYVVTIITNSANPQQFFKGSLEIDDISVPAFLKFP